MEDMLIQMAITLVLGAIKNPAKKASLKKAMLKIRDSINMAYASDKDFQ